MAVQINMATDLTTTKRVLSAAASVAATVMLFRSITQDMLPSEFYNMNIRKMFSRFSSQLTMVIHEFDGLVQNQIYEAAEIYLSCRLSPSTCTDQRFRVSKPQTERNFTLKMESNEEIIDIFNNVKFKWVFICRETESMSDNYIVRSEVRSFEVSYPKKYKVMALEFYLPYILKEAKSILQQKKTLKIFTSDISGNMWRPMNLDHPATFNTIAIDTDLKDRIMKDLDSFLKRKDYYRKVGKAWKRGYLLYGPPGTGKSSLIAAIANYLHFDVYDLELTQVKCNSDLRRVLLATANRSILVVEDIDCTIELQDRLAGNRENSTSDQVTLSGFLNFIDGLWPSCGDERIIIFTTNHKEKLDPALLRPGRMDFHIHMSYCTPSGFQVLASNYLGIKDHILFQEIKDLICMTQVTPADVAEQLMRSDELDTVLNDLIQFLQVRKKQNEEHKNQEESAVKKEEPPIKKCEKDEEANDDIDDQSRN
ncbi:AAA-ATPase At3g50940-like [Euphorbia lathyris]|uniref:AAA-ATPase At3g50940-like n=1 Tax=Euphorbia lathyris TaxID=212925 RepID=UPI0033134320